MDFASIGSMVVALIALLLSIYNGGKKETKESEAQMAKMMTMLDELTEDMREIKDDFRRDIAELKAIYQQDHDRIIKLEMSLDTAWKRIDEIRGTSDGREVR